MRRDIFLRVRAEKEKITRWRTIQSDVKAAYRRPLRLLRVAFDSIQSFRVLPAVIYNSRVFIHTLRVGDFYFRENAEVTYFIPFSLRISFTFFS